jgi:hypothetical protein
MVSFAAVAQNEDVITVGDGGTAANCTRSTLESAIALAASIPGPNRIWLTRNTSNGYYLLNNAALIDNQDLEIVGGIGTGACLGRGGACHRQSQHDPPGTAPARDQLADLSSRSFSTATP